MFYAVSSGAAINHPVSGDIMSRYTPVHMRLAFNTANPSNANVREFLITMYPYTSCLTRQLLNGDKPNHIVHLKMHVATSNMVIR